MIRLKIVISIFQFQFVNMIYCIYFPVEKSCQLVYMPYIIVCMGLKFLSVQHGVEALPKIFLITRSVVGPIFLSHVRGECVIGIQIRYSVITGWNTYGYLMPSVTSIGG